MHVAEEQQAHGERDEEQHAAAGEHGGLLLVRGGHQAAHGRARLRERSKPLLLRRRAIPHLLRGRTITLLLRGRAITLLLRRRAILLLLLRRRAIALLRRGRAILLLLRGRAIALLLRGRAILLLRRRAITLLLGGARALRLPVGVGRRITRRSTRRLVHGGSVAGRSPAVKRGLRARRAGPSPVTLARASRDRVPGRRGESRPPAPRAAGLCPRTEPRARGA